MRMQILAALHHLLNLLRRLVVAVAPVEAAPALGLLHRIFSHQLHRLRQRKAVALVIGDATKLHAY